jgi:hypothetical protein
VSLLGLVELVHVHVGVEFCGLWMLLD